MNIACVIKWKIHIIDKPTLKVNIINPKCLRVERAMTFLPSRLDTPLILDSIREDSDSLPITFIVSDGRIDSNRDSIITPAVTKVLE